MEDAPSSQDRNRGVLALVLIAPIWGYSWIAIKIALDYSSPYTFIAIATTACSALFLAALLVARRPLRPPPLRWTMPIGLLQTSLFNILATVALSLGGAGQVGVLAYTMPFWLLVFAWLFLGERLRGLQWPAVALAFAGLVLVVGPWNVGGALPGVLACTGGLVWAAAGLLIKLMHGRQRVDALSLTAWQMAFGAVPLVALALLMQSGRPQWTGTLIAALTYMVVLSSGLCWVLWTYALHSLPAGAAGMGTLAVPVIGVAAAWLQLGERPAPLEAVGMTLIVAALAALAAYGVFGGRRRVLEVGVDDVVMPPVIE
jgi:drug/metabolite transporter (DMT)-like permease